MNSINSFMDHNPSGRWVVLGASLAVALCGCVLMGIAGYSFAGGGAASPADPTRTVTTTTPGATTPTSSGPISPTLPVGTTPTVSTGITPTVSVDTTVTAGASATMAADAPCNCGDEESFRCRNYDTAPAGAAQACFDYCVGLGLGNTPRMDKDNDGLACND